MLLLTKYMVSKMKIFKVSPIINNKSMEAIGPQGVDSFDPRGLIGRIYVGDH